MALLGNLTGSTLTWCCFWQTGKYPVARSGMLDCICGISPAERNVAKGIPEKCGSVTRFQLNKLFTWRLTKVLDAVLIDYGMDYGKRGHDEPGGSTKDFQWQKTFPSEASCNNNRIPCGFISDGLHIKDISEGLSQRKMILDDSHMDACLCLELTSRSVALVSDNECLLCLHLPQRTTNSAGTPW